MSGFLHLREGCADLGKLALWTLQTSTLLPRTDLLLQRKGEGGLALGTSSHALLYTFNMAVNKACLGL
jgi:hypothetical protein